MRQPIFGKLFLGVIQKFLYGHNRKEPNLHNFAFETLFGSDFNTKTAPTKNIQIFALKSDRMARLIGTLSRTALFTLKHMNNTGYQNYMQYHDKTDILTYNHCHG